MILVAVNSVPIWEKANLNLEEAAAYFGIGINKLRDMTNENNCPFVLWNGNKRLIKRRAFERFWIRPIRYKNKWKARVGYGILIQTLHALFAGKE